MGDRSTLVLLRTLLRMVSKALMPHAYQLTGYTPPFTKVLKNGYCRIRSLFINGIPSLVPKPKLH